MPCPAARPALLMALTLCAACQTPDDAPAPSSTTTAAEAPAAPAPPPRVALGALLDRLQTAAVGSLAAGQLSQRGVDAMRLALLTRRVAALRGAADLSPPPVEVIDDDDAYAARLTAWFERHHPAPRLAAEGAIFARMGLIADATDYAARVREVMVEQPPLFYDEVAQRVVMRASLLDALSDPAAAAAVAAALAYPLLDQTRHLTTLLGDPTLDDDARLARLALVQGLSFALWYDHLAGGPRFADDAQVPGVLDGLEARARDGAQRLTPDAFVLSLALFPYFEGARHVWRRAHFAGDDMAAMLAAPPPSTLAVMIPEAADVTPTRVTLALAPGALDVKPEAEPWTRSAAHDHELVLGAFLLRAWLSLAGQERGAAYLVRGWRGDRLRAVDTTRGLVLIHASLWADEASAAAFEAAAAALFTLRHGRAAAWLSAVARRDRRVVWISGMLPSESADLERLLDHALSALPPAQDAAPADQDAAQDAAP